jgi:hypothetical protein
MTLGIKKVNIYDPFYILNCNNIDIFKNNIKSKKFMINTGKEKIDYKKYELVLSIINFNQANHELIERVIRNENILPIHYSANKIRYSSNNDDYKNYLTNKSAEYLPELILYLGDREICLYGYPFTLLENCEFM